MYKVFIQNKPLIFIKRKNIAKFNGIFVSENTALAKTEKVFELLNQDLKSILYVFCDDPTKTFQLFFENYQRIDAAGGIVKNKNSYLFIKRNGLWDLPKGKIDEGEKPKKAAVREIEEECGIKANKIEKLILETYHTYFFKNQHVLKKTYWYELSYAGNETLIPQLEEGITKVQWLKKSQLKKVYKNTYPSIADVLERYF